MQKVKILALIALPVLLVGGLLMFSPSSDAANISVSVQLTDQIGCSFNVNQGVTSAVSLGGQGGPTMSSVWARDSNAFDPDCIRVKLSGVSPDVDFRIGLQASDESCSVQVGGTRWTPWASQLDGISGSSGWVTDSNAFDPDCVRIGLQTQPMPRGVVLRNAKLGVSASDYACRSQIGDIEESISGEWSGWARDENGFDPDCFNLTLTSELDRLGVVTVRTESNNGASLPSTWKLERDGSVIANQNTPTIQTIYERASFGLYKVTDIQQTITIGTSTYKLKEVLPSNPRNLGDSSGTSCPAGQSRPYSTCSNGACISVTTSCGPTNCSTCGSGGGNPETEILQPAVLRWLKDLATPLALALVDGGTLKNCDTAKKACTRGGDGEECTSNAECGGYTTPPPAPTPPPPAPEPTAIVFTLRYELQPCTTDCGPVTNPPSVTCSPKTQTVYKGQTASTTAVGTSPFNWSAPGGTPASYTGAGPFFTTYATLGTKTITVSTSTASDACTVEVRRRIFDPAPCGGDPTGIYVSSNRPTSWTLTGPGNPYTEAFPTTEKGYDYPELGTYTLYPGNIAGYSYEVNPPAGNQTATLTEDSCGISFNIVYTESDGGNNPNNPPVCSPNYQAVSVGETASTAVKDGEAPFTWSAPGGSPATGSSRNFSTTYPSSGNKTITVKDNRNRTATCPVWVRPECNGPILNVRPTSRTIAVDEVTSYSAWYDADGTTCDGPEVNVTTRATTTWGISNGSIASPTGVKGSYQGLRPGSTNISATFGGDSDSSNITVTNAQDFSCELLPASATVQRGGSREGSVQCSPINGFTGSISLSRLSPPSGADMSFSPTSVTVSGPTAVTASYTFTAGINSPLGTYSGMKVRGTSGSLVHDYDFTPTITPATDALNVVLSAAPNPVEVNIPTILTADVSGTETGTMNYSFWWNCAYAGASVAEATDQCGAPSASGNSDGIKFDGTNEDPKSTPHAYAATGTKTALVIVERGTRSDYDSEEISVVPPSSLLNVSLAVDPSPVQLNSPANLIADVGGSATGPMNYYFWWDCGYRGNDVTEASSAGQCGAPSATGNSKGIIFGNTTNDPKTTAHSYSQLGVKNPLVIVQRGGQANYGFASVEVVTDSGSSGLSVSLSASPNPLDVDETTTLTADVSGTETGTINYVFWWDCAYRGASVAAANAACGTPTTRGNGYGIRFDGTSSDPQATTREYNSTGKKTPLVIVERGARSAYATIDVIVGNRTVDAAKLNVSLTNLPNPALLNQPVNLSADVGGTETGPMNYYFWWDCPYEGAAYAGAAAMCGAPTTSGNTYGRSFLGVNDDPQSAIRGYDLIGAKTPLVIVERGLYTAYDRAGLTVEDPDADLSCTFAPNPRIVRRGGDSTLSWSCSRSASCSISGTGISGGQQGSGIIRNVQTTTQYTLSCSGGGKSYTGRTTVYVQSIQEVPPGGN